MKLKSLFFIWVYLFIMQVPIIPIKSKFLGIPLSVDFITGGLIILTGMVYILLHRDEAKKQFKIIKDSNVVLFSFVIGIFIILSIGSIIYAADKGAVISESLRFIEYAALFFMILIIADKNFISKAIRLFYYIMILAAILGVVQFALNIPGWSGFSDPNVPLGRSRLYSTFVNPNYWGAAINLVIFYPIIDMLERRKKGIITNILVLILFLFNLVFSFTRGSWLGFAFGILVIFLIRYRKALISVPFFGALMLAVPFTRNRFLTIFDVSQVTNNQRLKLWKTGIAMFKENVWFGVGNGNYLHRYNEYIAKNPSLAVEKGLVSVHNSYIKMFAELGIFGGVFFIVVYLMLFFLMYKVYKRSRSSLKFYALSFLAFGGAYLFQNFFNNLMFIPQLNVFVWIIPALIYKGYLIERQEA